MKFSQLLPFLIALSTIAASAEAQSSLSAQSSGSGSMTYNRGTREVNSVRINLNRGGDFDITIVGADRANVTGSWRRGRAGQYALTIARIGRQRASGTGTLTVNGSNRVQALTLTGFVAQQRFAVTFEGGRSGGWNGGDNDNGSGWGGGGNSGGKFRDFNGSKSGSGGLDFERRTKDIDRAEVRLNRSGRFEINFRGEAKFKVLGTWRWKGNDIELRVEDTLGDNRASGTGILHINRNGDDFWKISLRGRAKGQSFSVGFNE